MVPSAEAEPMTLMVRVSRGPRVSIFQVATPPLTESALGEESEVWKLSVTRSVTATLAMV